MMTTTMTVTMMMVTMTTMMTMMMTTTMMMMTTTMPATMMMMMMTMMMMMMMLMMMMMMMMMNHLYHGERPDLNEKHDILFVCTIRIVSRYCWHIYMQVTYLLTGSFVICGLRTFISEIAHVLPHTSIRTYFVTHNGLIRKLYSPYFAAC